MFLLGGRYKLSLVTCRLFSPHFLRRTALRDRLDLLLPAHDCVRDIECAVACTILFQILIPVITGADDIQILLPHTLTQPTGTCPVAIVALVDQEALD